MNKKILLVGGAIALGALFLFSGKSSGEQSMGGSFGGVDTEGYADQLGGGSSPTYVFNTEFPEQAVATDAPNYFQLESLLPTASINTQPIYSGVNQNSSLSKVTNTQQGVAVTLGVPASYINPNVNTSSSIKSSSAGLINYINPNVLAGASTIKNTSSSKGAVYSGVNQNSSKTPAVTKVPTTAVTNKSSPSVIKKTATSYFMGK